MKIIVWKLLVVLRIIVTFVLQTGYIHPDEFFQSIEVLAGNIFNLEVHHPWEFNATLTERPLRSIVVPYITTGLPLLVLRQISSLAVFLFGLPLVSPYLLLLLPRLCVTFLSFAVDVCLYRVCRLYQKNHVTCLITYASSYVALVHMTRTLSNAVETILLAMMLFVVATCMYDIDKKVLRGDKTNRFNCPRCNQVALLLTIGVFNRPTFVVFAFVPVLIWILYGYSITLLNTRWFFLRIWSLVPGITATSAVLILCDTLYYRFVYFADIRFDMQSLLEAPWVITPLNFFLYNTNRTNLVKHGLHPPYLHILVNLPMLFGTLGIIALLQYLKLNFMYIWRYNWNMPSIEKMMQCSFIVPLLLLSLIPHQEPRFIIALLFPLVFLHGERLWGRGRLMRVVQMLWIFGNCLGFAVFGFLHQGGIIPSLIHLQSLQAKEGFKSAHVVFYHTYMPPRCLLLNYKGASVRQEDPCIHDIMGGSSGDLQQQIQSLQNSPGVYVISPSSLRNEVMVVLRPYGGKLMETFAMHISMEDPPTINQSFLSHLGLDLYAVKFARPKMVS